MNKKQFIALADIAKRVRGQEDQGTSNRVIGLLADFCELQNSKFDREKWLGYIEGTNGENGGKVKASSSSEDYKPNYKPKPFLP